MKANMQQIGKHLTTVLATGSELSVTYVNTTVFRLKHLKDKYNTIELRLDCAGYTTQTTARRMEQASNVSFLDLTFGYGKQIKFCRKGKRFKKVLSSRARDGYTYKDQSVKFNDTAILHINKEQNIYKVVELDGNEVNIYL